MPSRGSRTWSPTQITRNAPITAQLSIVSPCGAPRPGDGPRLERLPTVHNTPTPISPSPIQLVGRVVALLAGGAYVFHLVEGWRYLDALYFCVITLTTTSCWALASSWPS